ncbi:MAG: glycosyltransferase [Planctomycetes bacterium]|nr:glycosyltransferase [Planctomycetota bacterium]
MISEDGRRRVLCIAHAFPPCGGAGVQRTAKFVRYLPEHDWLPTVLTVAPSSYGLLDSSQAAECLPGVDVVRTPHLDPVARFTRPTPGSQGVNGQPNGASSARRWSPRRVVRRILRQGWIGVEDNLLVPDRTLLWYPWAVAAGSRLLRRRRFDLIWATGEPYSAYFIARALSRRSGVPFVIDMRDPWTLEPYRAEVRPAWRSALERRQERSILAACRACVFAIQVTEQYAAAFPQWAGKFHYIPNGYDPADFAGVAPQRFDRFTIVHSGTFLPGYRPARPFLLALRELLNQEPGLAARAQVLFAGKPGAESQIIQELGLAGLVRQVGYLPHRESISYLLGADLLLLIGGHHRWEETGKIYEYLAAGKPILALVHPEGSAARLLRSYSLARVVDRENTKEAAAALQNLLTTPPEVRTSPEDPPASRFERGRLTGQLAAVLNSCCPEGRFPAFR